MSMPSYDPNNDPGAQPGYGQQQPYGGQQGYGQPAKPARNGLGTAALVLGILAIVTGFFYIGLLFGIVAVVLGVIGRGRAKRGEATNGGVALAGIITGIVGIVASAVIIAFTVFIFSSSSFSNLTDCLSSAGNNQSQMQQCQTQFNNNLGG